MIRSVTRRAFILALLFVLAAVATVPAQSRSFLWKATNARGSVYLAGSIHMLTADAYPLSPAFDAAPVGLDCPATDQRGIPRPQGAGCDIGAFEK